METATTAEKMVKNELDDRSVTHAEQNDIRNDNNASDFSATLN